MDVAAAPRPTRLPRFRRASEPPAFRLTDADVEIVRHIARYRFLRSTHIAALVGRSLDRTNDRLLRLFHAGYIDRPRAQLDYYPTSGSAPLVYSLADRGARLLAEHDGVAIVDVEWSRKNREAGRPFIEHQIEIVNFQVALQRAVAQRRDVRLISAQDMNSAASRQPMPVGRAPFALRAKLSYRGTVREISVVPDLVFGLQLANGERRNFMVEIDRGTMPITRSDIEQTSVERKMRAYLAAHAAKQHERQFGWKTFRVLTVTTDHQRMLSIKEALRQLHVARSPGASLFLFGTVGDLRATTPLAHEWLDGNNREVDLI
jgi:DNA-binding Lrp family transcriptional regulator